MKLTESLLRKIIMQEMEEISSQSSKEDRNFFYNLDNQFWVEFTSKAKEMGLRGPERIKFRSQLVSKYSNLVKGMTVKEIRSPYSPATDDDYFTLDGAKYDSYEKSLIFFKNNPERRSEPFEYFPTEIIKVD